MKTLFAQVTASISELKLNPTSILEEAEGQPVAILNHNQPEAYLIPAETYEWLMEKIDDLELAQIVKEREHEKKDAIEMSLDEL